MPAERLTRRAETRLRGRYALTREDAAAIFSELDAVRAELGDARSTRDHARAFIVIRQGVLEALERDRAEALASSAKARAAGAHGLEAAYLWAAARMADVISEVKRG